MAVHEDCELCTTPFLVLAPTYAAFRDYIRHGNRPQYHYRMVTRVDQLCGMAGSTLLVIGRQEEIPNFEMLVAYASAYRVRVEYAKDFVPFVPLTKPFQEVL